MASNTKLRVLCLHGYRQSAPTFHKKSGAFRKIVKQQVDFVDITAPHQIEGVDEAGGAKPNTKQEKIPSPSLVMTHTQSITRFPKSLLARININ